VRLAGTTETRTRARRRRAGSIAVGAVVALAVGGCGVSAAPNAGNSPAPSDPTPAASQPTPTADPNGNSPSDTPNPTPTASPATSPTSPQPAGLTTSCTKVVHVGDSTSVGLMSRISLPKRKDWIDVQYRKVGAQEVKTDISGARSIVERWHHQPNAQDAVAKQLDQGYDGCWVIAMGTNEAANQAVGGVTSLARRIDLIMNLISDHPVLWLTVKTLRDHGPYAEKQMLKWDDALVAGCQRYPSMRVYDWAGQVKNSWYINDDIHFTTKGYQQRAKRTAQSLAVAFPKDAPSPPGCLVVPPPD